MAIRLKRGFGDATSAPVVPGNPCDTRWAWAIPKCWFAPPASIAPAPAPTGDVLTVPPASEAEAQATVDTLINQQTADQQALDAANVQPSVIGDIYGSVSDAAAGIGSISPMVWLGLGVGLFAIFSLSGGRRR